MTAPEEAQASLFTVILKADKAQLGGHDETKSSGAAVKYTKSASSLGSRSSQGEANAGASQQYNSAGGQEEDMTSGAAVKVANGRGFRGPGGEANIVEVQPTENAIGQEEKTVSETAVRNTSSRASGAGGGEAKIRQHQNAAEMGESPPAESKKKKGKSLKSLAQLAMDKEGEVPECPSDRSLGAKADFFKPEAGTSHMSRLSDSPSNTDVKDRKFKHQKHSLWYRLRHRITHMGVMEVNSQHPFYYRLKAIANGLCAVLNDNPDSSAPCEELEKEHYQAVIRRELTLQLESGPDKTASFLFESYAPVVFATIRRAVSVVEKSYNEAIMSRNQPFLEFLSNSRSGQDFFLSSDMRFLIKTNKKKDVMFLLSVLEKYLGHFLSYPHSLLVKYVGCYSVKFTGKQKIFFLVMQNIFYPAERIEDRFDVKGCTAGRYQEPEPPGSGTITVLKDQNFFQEELLLGSNKEWFISQITADASFLESLNVMDYSLLIGRQRHYSGKTKHSLACFVSQLTRSKLKTPPTSPPTSANLSGNLKPVSLSPEDRVSLPGTVEIQPSSQSQFLHSLNPSKSMHFPHSLSAESPETMCGQRRRLLPDCSNALHIIDGPEYRYFLGIVDFLTRWTMKQKAARVWKVVKYGCGEHSTMPPHYYSQRFVRFLTNRVT